MTIITRRSVLRSSLAFGAAGALARPYIANAAATTIEVWLAQGFVPRGRCRLQGDGRRLREGERQQDRPQPHSLCGAAPEGDLGNHQRRRPGYDRGRRLRISRRLQAWDDKLVDLSDVVEPVKGQFIPTALPCCYFYNNVAKKRGYYVLPMKIAAVPFHIWKSLVEKGGAKIADLPKTWDAFLDFFMPVQDRSAQAGDAQHLRLWLSADHRPASTR